MWGFFCFSNKMCANDDDFFFFYTKTFIQKYFLEELRLVIRCVCVCVWHQSLFNLITNM